jgi:hypothetical protein
VKGHVYVPSANEEGYRSVGIQKSGSRLVQSIKIHRFVHVVFNDPGLEQYIKGATVDHIDGDRGNNHRHNLRWASSIEQAANRTGSNIGGSRPKRVNVNVDGVLHTFDSIGLAAETLGLSRDLITSKRYFGGFVPDDDLDGEEWKLHSHGCWVSSEGRYSMDMLHKAFPSCNPNGYRLVYIKMDGKKQNKLQLSHLILEAFVGPMPSPQHTADHINKNRSDNRVKNLRWATKSEQASNRNAPKLRHTIQKVESSVENSGIWVLHSSAAEASEATGVSTASIRALCSGRYKLSRVCAMRKHRYAFRYVIDDAVDRLDDECWERVNVEDWAVGGKYHLYSM